MGSWGSTDGEVELEEGEAICCGVDDDASIDPDIALSYLDEKLQNVLGHFLKDFEGELSAENLGAKFGGYGSFLPMYQRSPPTWSQPKTPPRVQNHSTSRSPNDLCAEGGIQNSTTSSDAPVLQMRGTPVSNNMHLSQNLNCLSGDGSEREVSHRTAERVPDKPKSFLNNEVNPPDQRKLTVRIKVVPDKGSQKNAAIYSGLGLTSPSSSMGDSPEESYESPLSSEDILRDSPAGILQVLTTLPVSSDLLISPLHGNLLNLITTGKESADSKPTAILEGHDHIVRSGENLDSALGAEEILTAKRSKSMRMGENDVQSRVENKMHYVDRKSADNSTLNSKPCFPQHKNVDNGWSFKGAVRAPEAVRQPEQHMPVKKRELKKDKVEEIFTAHHFIKDETVEDVGNFKHQESRSHSVETFDKHGLKSSEMDDVVDCKEDIKSKDKNIYTSLSYASEGKMDSFELLDPKHEKVVKVAAHDCNRKAKLNGKSSASRKLSSEGKKKSRGSQVNGNLASHLTDGGLKSGCPVAGNNRSAWKDVSKVRDSYKDLLDTNLEYVNDQSGMQGRLSAHKSQDSNHENFLRTRGVSDISRVKSVLRRSSNQAESQFSQKEILTDNVPCSNGLMSGAETVTPKPILIKEEWVLCDRCGKWRLGPPGMDSKQLPEKWACSMLDWLPGKNHCDISEDETTQAVRVLFPPPPSEIQDSLQSEADAFQAQPNVGAQQLTSLGKEEFISPDSSHINCRSGAVINSHLMRNPRQVVLKNTSMKDTNQPSPEANLINKSNTKHLKKSYQVEDKCSEFQEGNGQEKPRKKLRRERNSDQSGQGAAKKVKTEGTMDMHKSFSFENDGNLGKFRDSSSASLPTKAALREKGEQIDLRENQKLQFSLKKQRDSLQGLIDSGSLDVRAYESVGRSTKKRRLKDWGDGQDYLQGKQSSRDLLQDTKPSVKEAGGDSGYRSEKRSKASVSDETVLSKARAGDKSVRGNKKDRMHLSGDRVDSVDKISKKAKQLKAKLASRVTVKDVEEMKKDLGSEQFSAAATSSSSKVSNSLRSRANYQEVRGSPVESVSSSPLRPSFKSKVSPVKTRDLGKDDPKFCKFSVMQSRSKPVYVDDAFKSSQYGTAMKERVINTSFEINARGNGSSALSGPEDVCVGNIDAENSGGYSLCPVDVHGGAHQISKFRMSNNHHDPIIPMQRPKSGVDFSARSNNKICGSNLEKFSDKVSNLTSELEALHWKKSLRDWTEVEQNYCTSSHEVVSDLNHPFSDESTHKVFKQNDSVLQRYSGEIKESGQWGDYRRQSQLKHGEWEKPEGRMSAQGSVHTKANRSHTLVQDSEAETEKSISTEEEARSGKLLVCSSDDDKIGSIAGGSKSATESQKGGLSELRPLDTLTGGEKTARNAVLLSGDHGSMRRPGSDQCGDQDKSGPSHTKKEAPILTASAALMDAEKHRVLGDRLKESGFGPDCNYAYFQAALMFLLGAALLESSSNESQKGEMNQMQIYGSTAKLCETCALEYEKHQEMAAAALAYKCMEVAYLRVIYCRNSSTNRVLQDLQTSLQMFSQIESPSSSASDIDNLNNQAAADKAALCKGNGSVAGTHIIAPRNRPNFLRLLDFTKDVNSAMEAAKKSQSAFAAAAKLMAEHSQNNDIIASVKRAVDFSYLDVEEFVRVVRHAIGAISPRGFGGS